MGAARLSEMKEKVQPLTEREKETLRLLLAGHDAKSIARDLKLSVHTVNERLRDARRKLGVSSSREAARVLAAAEHDRPQSLADKDFGVAREAPGRINGEQSDRLRRAAHPLVWLGGGMLMMSLIIAAAVMSLQTSSGEAPAPSLVAIAASTSPAQTAASKSALEWVGLVDRKAWEESWRAAGGAFKAQLSAAQWAATVQPVRAPLGAVSTRALQSATKASSLPGLPAGDYEIVQFKTSFAAKNDAIETFVLAQEGSSWKVIGYFIR